MHGRSQWLTSCYTKKQYQKVPLWAGNEPGCSACSGHCWEKRNFGCFLYQTFFTLIKLSCRYCKVPVKMVSECWAVAWKWWVIKLLGKIFWQESVRRVDSILGIIFSSSVICIASPVQTQEGSHCPQPQVGWLLAARTGLAVPPCWAVAAAIPGSPAGDSGSRSAHTGLSSPQQLLPLGCRVISSSWSADAFTSEVWALGPCGEVLQLLTYSRYLLKAFQTNLKTWQQK